MQFRCFLIFLIFKERSGEKLKVNKDSNILLSGLKNEAIPVYDVPVLKSWSWGGKNDFWWRWVPISSWWLDIFKCYNMIKNLKKSFLDEMIADEGGCREQHGNPKFANVLVWLNIKREGLVDNFEKSSNFGFVIFKSNLEWGFNCGAHWGDSAFR